MAHVAPNADLYAESRQNIFFPGVVPSLDGQCVSQAKWFMQDMSDVPNPQAARGDARYVGKTLVAQGHAVEVPFSDRKRGDLVCYEYGTYGHIGTQLSGGRIFEQNVNMGGVQSKIVDGERVYASRIGSENEAWRVGKNPHIYRLKTYREDSMDTPIDVLRVIASEVEGFPMDETHAGKYDKLLKESWGDKPANDYVRHAWSIQPTHRGHLVNDIAAKAAQISALTAQIADLKKNSCTSDERAFLDLRKKI